MSDEHLRRLFRAEGDASNLPPRWNLAPSQYARVVRRRSQDAGTRSLSVLRWGLMPHFTNNPDTALKPFNARAETIMSSGMFRSAFAARRCLVPAELFYEWRVMADGRQPHAIARRDGAPLALGGVWEGWLSPDGEAVRTFAIVTTAANADVRPLHDRMPLVIEEEDWSTWLGETGADVPGLLKPARNGTLKTWPVSTRLNSPGNNDASLIEPLQDGAALRTSVAG